MQTQHAGELRERDQVPRETTFDRDDAEFVVRLQIVAQAHDLAQTARIDEVQSAEVERQIAIAQRRRHSAELRRRRDVEIAAQPHRDAAALIVDLGLKLSECQGEIVIHMS